MTFATPPGGPVEGEPKVRCTRLRIPTYDAEWIDLSVMTRQDITIEKRLDLFVFEFVERLWQVLPAPRRVLFSMKYGEATRTGLERLWDLCGRSADGSRAAVVITDITEERCRQLINRRDAYVDRRKAEAAVGVGDPLSLQVPVRVWRGD